MMTKLKTAGLLAVAAGGNFHAAVDHASDCAAKDALAAQGQKTAIVNRMGPGGMSPEGRGTVGFYFAAASFGFGLSGARMARRKES